MNDRELNASDAAARLGVTTKALRLYERRGLLTPRRSAAGYRAYGPEVIQRASQIVALRALGLSLAQMAGVLDGDPHSREAALGAHQASLGRKIGELAGSIDKIRRMRAAMLEGERSPLPVARGEFDMDFDLPWPWGGERFELRNVGPLNYIVGPLGSGKTRLAMRLAEALPNAAFLGLERGQNPAAIATQLGVDDSLKSRVDQALAWLIWEGALPSAALSALVVGLETTGPAVLVVDLVEQGLDQATQEALIRHLRRGARTGARPLFLMTRSTSILDLSAVGPDEAIILCPANHSPPTRIAPHPGAPGYEAVATSLASPRVRARLACRPQAA